VFDAVLIYRTKPLLRLTQIKETWPTQPGGRCPTGKVGRSRATAKTLADIQPGDSVAREQRKLAAILAADAVGSPRLMGRAESGTLEMLSE